MKFHPGRLPGIIHIEPEVHRDVRGFFLETFQQQKFKAGGVSVEFVQHNHSKSGARTLRGLHAQLKHPQGKVVRVVVGEIFDVAVSIRRGSPTFGQWEGARLSAENLRQVYIPPGFAHGFCVLSDVAEVEYFCTDFYDPTDEVTVIWNDPEIAIDWPIKDPLVSEKDQQGRRLSDLLDLLG